MTIFALSSGPGISGVAVIRVSGDNTTNVIKQITGKDLPVPRAATLRHFNKINSTLYYCIICYRFYKSTNRTKESTYLTKEF